MNNKDKIINTRMLTIFLPVALLLVLILILLYNFGITSKQAAKSVVEDELNIQVEDFGALICEELNIMTRMGEAFRDMLTIMSIEEPNDALQMIGTLSNNSNAYMVVYCDEKGIGVTQSGIKVNVGKDNFLHSDSDKYKEQYYAYLQKEKIMQAEAVVSVIPVVGEEKVEGYILMYYSVSRIRKIFTQNNTYGDAFLLFSVDDGIIITTEGLKEKPTAGTTLVQFLKKLDAREEADSLQSAMKNQKSISIFLTMEDASGYVIYAPIGINDWYIAIGFKEALYDHKLTDEWGSMKNLITYLLVLIFIFVFGMIGITIVMSVAYRKHNKSLQKEADMDMLTGLYNKMATERKIKQYMKENPNSDAILFVLDIDDFKRINDSMGHIAGDAALKTIGCYMKEKFGVYNVLGRVGGDEFIIFVKDIKSEQLLKKEIQKVNDVFKVVPKSEDAEKSISVSIGAAVYPKDAGNFEELYKMADKALYEAKKNGKNQLVQIVNNKG